MKNRFLIVLFFSVFAFSCSSYYRMVDNVDRPKEVISDSKAIQYNTNTNKFETAVTGIEEVKDIEINPDEIHRIEPDRPFNLILRSVDLSVYTLFSRYNEKEDVVEVGLVRIANHKIELKNQCETIRWMDPYYVPKIEVSDQLKVHQIVITPIMDNNCEKKGYEIRYGSQDRGGCSSQAADVYNRYVNCTKKARPISKRVNILDVIVE